MLIVKQSALSTDTSSSLSSSTPTAAVGPDFAAIEYSPGKGGLPRLPLNYRFSKGMASTVANQVRRHQAYGSGAATPCCILKKPNKTKFGI